MHQTVASVLTGTNTNAVDGLQSISKRSSQLLFPPIRAELPCYKGLLVVTADDPSSVYLVSEKQCLPITDQKELWPVFEVKTLPVQASMADTVDLPNLLPYKFSLVQTRYPAYCPLRHSRGMIYASCSCEASPDIKPDEPMPDLFGGVWFGHGKEEHVRLMLTKLCFYEPFMVPLMCLLSAGVQARVVSTENDDQDKKLSEDQIVMVDSNWASGHQECLPSRYVIYQLEQLTYGYWKQRVPAICKGALAVLDYHPANVKFLAQHQVTAGLVKPGYHPLWELRDSIPHNVQRSLGKPANEHIDVLFCGSQTPYRTALLDRIRDRGLNVECVVPVAHTYWGTWEFTERIRMAKVVLNCHQDAQGILELWRVWPLLCSGKVVVSETSADNHTFGLDSLIKFSDYEGIPDVAYQLCQKADRRAEHENFVRGAMESGSWAWAIPHSTCSAFPSCSPNFQATVPLVAKIF